MQGSSSDQRDDAADVYRRDEWTEPYDDDPDYEDAPLMGRAGRVAYIAFIVAMAFASVWLVARTANRNAPEPTSQSAETRTTAPPPITGLDPAPAVDDDSRPPAVDSVLPPPAPPPAPSEPLDRAVIEPPPRTESVVPAERPVVAAPPRRPPVESTPAPAPRVPVDLAPSPPRLVAAQPASPPVPRAAPAESAPVVRVEVAEPVLQPPAAPPAQPLLPDADVARPPAAAATSAAPARSLAVERDSNAILDVLGRYRTAFNSLDVNAVQRVWPTVNQRTLARAFEQLEKQNVSFDGCAVDVKGVLGEARCSGTTRFVPRVGNRTGHYEPRQWSFSLRKGFDGWVIQEVEAR